MYNLIFIPLSKKVNITETGYFIEQFGSEDFEHGGITCVDIERVLRSKGFRPILLPHQQVFSWKAKLHRLWFMARMIFRIRPGIAVVFIFPVYARLNRWLIRCLRTRGAKLVCIVADIEGIRDADEKLRDREFAQFSKWKYFIAHNACMAALLKQEVPAAVIRNVGLFDFLTKPVFIDRKKSLEVVFAGNLAKSGFLHSLDRLGGTGVQFHLYGPGVPGEVVSFANVVYYGVFKPYSMPVLVEGSFGLVWDGISIDHCAGGYGEYLRYNSQHKLSLYILAGLPVIIWREAATAEIVRRFGIGVVIDSLHELGQVINQLAEDQYQEMRMNMHALAQKISQGENLSLALDDLFREIF